MIVDRGGISLFYSKKQKYKIVMKDSTLGDYLSHWERLIKKACKQDLVKIEKWLKEEYPAISTKAGTWQNLLG